MSKKGAIIAIAYYATERANALTDVINSSIRTTTVR